MRCCLSIIVLGLCGCVSGALAGTSSLEFTQIVQQPFGFGAFEPSISADGSRVAFRTTGDLTGGNPDGNFEIFVWDRATGQTTQLTNTPTGVGNFVPMLTADGSKVVFRSLFDFTGEGNAGTFELWEVDIATGAFRQVTDNPVNTPVFDPRISGDGNFLVFLARINPTGENPDGSLEVFRVHRETGALLQISNNQTVAAQFPDINGDGSVIVWGDRANYDGTNTNGGLEIWKWDGSTGQITAVTNQTSSVLETNLPRVDAEGRYVSFVSLFDFSGNNAVGRKVHVSDTSTGEIRLITNPGVGGSGADYPDAEISPDGTTVYFESNINLGGQNPDGNRELWAYTIATHELTAVTNTTLGVSIIQLSDDATRRYLDVSANHVVTYRSDQDLDPAVMNGRANLDLFVSAPPPGPACPGDTNGDGIVNFSDLNTVLSQFGQTGQGLAGDVNGDGTVNFADLNDVLANFGVGCN